MGAAAGPRVILEASYPSDSELLLKLKPMGLVDAVFLPDLPQGLVNVDSLAAGLALQADMGIGAIAAVALGQRSAAASASRIAAAYAFGLRGVLLIGGDVKACGQGLSVLDAVALASSLPGVDLPQGMRASSTLKDALGRRRGERFEVGCAVDLRSPDSMRAAAEKVRRGATLLMSQLVPRPASVAQQAQEALSWGAALAVGVPYAETEGAAARFEAIIGERPPAPGAIAEELGELARLVGPGRLALYVSPLGRKEGLASFLVQAASALGVR